MIAYQNVRARFMRGGEILSAMRLVCHFDDEAILLSSGARCADIAMVKANKPLEGSVNEAKIMA